MTALRWLAMLPGALAAGWCAWGVVTLLNRITFSLSGINPDWFVSRLYIEGVSHGVLGAAVVYVGVKIAPARRSEALFALAALSLLGAGLLLFPAFLVGDWWAIYGVVALAVGSSCVVVGFVQEARALASEAERSTAEALGVVADAADFAETSREELSERFDAIRALLKTAHSGDWDLFVTVATVGTRLFQLRETLPSASYSALQMAITNSLTRRHPDGSAALMHFLRFVSERREMGTPLEHSIGRWVLLNLNGGETPQDEHLDLDKLIGRFILEGRASVAEVAPEPMADTAEDARHTTNREQWVINRLVEAVETGDPDVKAQCGTCLLARYEGGEWQMPREVETGRILLFSALDPSESDWDVVEVLEGRGVSEARLEALENGEELTASERRQWEDEIARSALNIDSEPDWAILELKHSDPRRLAYMAVTDWDGASGCFVAAHSSHEGALNALREIGFTGQKDYYSRRPAGASR